MYGHLRKYLVKPGDKVTKETIIGITGCSGGSRVPHLHLEIRKNNTDETGLDYTIDPLSVLPKIDLESLNEEFKVEPYSKLWNILVSNNPWSFTKEDIPYSNNTDLIR